MAAIVPVKKRLVLFNKIYFLIVKNAAGHHPGPVLPSTTDGVPFQ